MQDKKEFHPLVKRPEASFAGLAAMGAPYLFSAAGLIKLGTAGLISMGVGIVYGLAQSALVKPPQRRSQNISGGTPGLPPAGALRNQARIGGPAQFLHGKRRIYPPAAAVPYTEQAGFDTYQRFLLHIGDGEYDISEIEIGETAITSYAGDYETADGHITDSAVQAIYPDDVTPEATLPVEVTFASGGLIKTTAANTTEISVTVGCPNGLYAITDTGNYRGQRVNYTVRYRTNSPQGSWINFSGSPYSPRWKTQGLAAWNHRVTGLSSDTYDVEVVKTNADHPPPESGEEVTQDDFYWMALNSINTGQDAVNDTDAYLLAVRIKLTGNFDSGIDTINCVAERKVSAWSGAAWGAVAVSRSPAWAFADILRTAGTGNTDNALVADSKIDGDALLDWHNNCVTNGFNFDGMTDGETTAKQRLEQIARIGRASRDIINGLHTVVQDETQASNLQHFSPRNSWDFSGHRDYLDYPHAIRCQYIEPTNGYQVEEIIVCDDGYYEDVPSSATWQASTAYNTDDWVTPSTPNGFYYKCTDDGGTSGGGEPSWPTTPRETVTDNNVEWMCHTLATDFEALDFTDGVTDSDHVWKLARYHMAVARLRSETFSFSTDAENLRVTRGDRVGFTHDVVLVGQGQARIKSIAGSDVTMDDSITMEGGKTYGTIVRKADATFLSTTITLDVGEQTTVTLGSVLGIAVGDLMFFGETGSITQDCIIKEINYGPDLSAKLTLTNYDENIQSADSGTIPTYTPVISTPPELNRVPPEVTILTINVGYWAATDHDLSQKALHAFVTFSLGMSTEIDPYYFQVQYQSYDNISGDDYYSEWFYAPDVPVDVRTARIPVQDGSTYNFRIRSVSRYGITGPWSDDAIADDYAVSYSGLTPNDIAGLALVQGGSTWAGLDCAIEWTAPTDTWRVKKVKIETYKTSPLTLLRPAEYVDPNQNTYTYTYAMNEEDNGGQAIGGLTFRVYAVSQNDDEGTHDELAVTHTAPSSVTSLAGVSWSGGVEFTWDENTDSAFSHFEYRIKVGAALNGESWYRKQSPQLRRMLTPTEKDTYGVAATVYFECRAVDKFGTPSGTSSTSQAAGALGIVTADIDDYQLTPAKFYTPVILVDGLSITNNSPSAGYVAWDAFTIYFDGTAYSITPGNSNYEFINFRNLSTTLEGSPAHPDEQWSDWDPSNDFNIIWNNNGVGKAVWSTMINVVMTNSYIGTAAIATANIQTAAITNALVNDLSADKINAGTLSADRIGANSLEIGKFDQTTIDSYGPIIPDPTFALTTTVNDTDYWDLDVVYKAWGASYGENSTQPGVQIECNGSNHYLIAHDGQGSDRYYPAAKGDKIVAKVRIYKSFDFDGSVYFGCWERDENKSSIGTNNADIEPDNTLTWETKTAQVTLSNTDCHFIFLYILVAGGTTGDVRIDSVNVVKEQAANFRSSNDYTKINGGDVYVGSEILVGSGSTDGKISIGSATYGAAGIQLHRASSVNKFYVGDGSNEYFKYDGTNVEISTSKSDGLIIKNGGDIKLETGGDIHLYSATGGNSAQIVMHGNARTFTFDIDYDTDYLQLYPDTDEFGSFSIGTATKIFDNVHIRADDLIDIQMATGKNIYMTINGLWIRHSSEINIEGPLFIEERTAADTDKAGYGQLWIKNTTPCELWFTDDAGTDTQIV